jgi:transcriptional regulator with XRE-family HTH domain
MHNLSGDLRRSRPLLRTTLGDVLRRTRLAQGRTLADVAKAARISMQYLSELERGRKEASSEILAAICDALHVDLPDVLAEVGRELAGAGAGTTPQQAVVLRLGTGPDRLGTGQSGTGQSGAGQFGIGPLVQPGDVVSLLAA